MSTSDAASARLLLGDTVSISGVKSGILRYFGPTKFAAGDWCGIELSCLDGKHDGALKGVRYFTCPPNQGIFAPSHKVALVSKTVSTETKSSKEQQHSLPPGSKVARLAKDRKSVLKLRRPPPVPKSKKASLNGNQEGGQPRGRTLGRSSLAVKGTVKKRDNNTNRNKPTFDLHSSTNNYQLQSYIDPHKALTFAYDIEPNSPESDLTTQQLNNTFKVEPNVTTRRQGLPRSHSSIPDLLNPAFTRGAKLPRSLSQFAVVSSILDGTTWREGFDPLTPSHLSNASSLGLLSDTQLGSLSLHLDHRSVCATPPDYELDWDMSDISSPELHHKDGSPSPTHQVYYGTTELVTPVVPLQLKVHGGHTSTPVSPVKVTGDVVIDGGDQDFVIADDVSHDLVTTDDIGHGLITTGLADHDFVKVNDSGHDLVTAADGSHDLVVADDVGHDLVTTDDDGHDLVASSGHDFIKVDDIGLCLVTADDVSHDLVSDDGDNDFIKVSDNSHDLVTTGDGEHQLVTVDNDSHDFVTTADGAHDLVTTIDNSHDLVATGDPCHDVVTSSDGGHDLVTTGDGNNQDIESTGQEYTMTSVQEPSSVADIWTIQPVSEATQSVTMATEEQALVKEPECPVLTIDLPSDDNTVQSSQMIVCDGEHSSKLKDTNTEDQLLADLSEGHHKRERPVSVLSTCSTDTGVDLDTVSDRQRPVSIISVSSIDTGKCLCIYVESEPILFSSL